MATTNDNPENTNIFYSSPEYKFAITSIYCCIPDNEVLLYEHVLLQEFEYGIYIWEFKTDDSQDWRVIEKKGFITPNDFVTSKCHRQEKHKSDHTFDPDEPTTPIGYSNLHKAGGYLIEYKCETCPNKYKEPCKEKYLIKDARENPKVLFDRLDKSKLVEGKIGIDVNKKWVFQLSKPTR
jgi:hypothetical protein